uniref:Uncharacterized protein n=1 Tax=Rangifer tarandus platyrhynchus TaxID=3082113 RepID=A0ACB0E2U8_RANTA|nr:unnamed protein product [Rangifer tarandus platyrhynchus]
MGLAEMLTASAQTSSGAGKHWPNLVFFRAKRKMQRLLSLKKDRRPRSQGVRKTPGTPASSRSRPGSRLAVAPARTTYRPGAAARGPPTARCPARRPRLRCLCVPATRLEDLGAEPPTRGAEPQILTFPTVSAKCARCQRRGGAPGPAPRAPSSAARLLPPHLLLPGVVSVETPESRFSLLTRCYRDNCDLAGGGPRVAVDACFKSKVQRDSLRREGRSRRAVRDVWEWRRSRGSLRGGGVNGQRSLRAPRSSPMHPTRKALLPRPVTLDMTLVKAHPCPACGCTVRVLSSRQLGTVGADVAQMTFLQMLEAKNFLSSSSPCPGVAFTEQRTAVICELTKNGISLALLRKTLVGSGWGVGMGMGYFYGPRRCWGLGLQDNSFSLLATFAKYLLAFFFFGKKRNKRRPGLLLVNMRP